MNPQAVFAGQRVVLRTKAEVLYGRMAEVGLGSPKIDCKELVMPY